MNNITTAPAYWINNGDNTFNNTQTNEKESLSSDDVSAFVNGTPSNLVSNNASLANWAKKEFGIDINENNFDALQEAQITSHQMDAQHNYSLKYLEEYYPKLMQGLQQSGLNPFLAVSGGLSGGSSQPSASASRGSLMDNLTSKRSADTSEKTRALVAGAGIVVAIIKLLAMTL